MALDEKMWMDITALHVAASYLDPSLKSFSFVKDGKELRNLLKQAVQAARENAMHFNGILVSDDSDTSDLEDMTASDLEDTSDLEDKTERSDNETSTKKAKYDPFAEFRNVASSTSKSSGHVSDFEADVDAEFRHYNPITVVDLQQPDAVRSVFDPLLWWDSRALTFRF